MGKHSKTERKIRYSFRLYPSELQKFDRIRETFGYTFQEVLEMLINNEVSLDALYQTTFNVVKDGQDVTTVS
jgi:hypothetical protein